MMYNDLEKGIFDYFQEFINRSNLGN